MVTRTNHRARLPASWNGLQVKAHGAWIDVSMPVESGMVHWPDNPAVVLERTLDITRGDAANVSKLSCGVHTGTHVDAPVHFRVGAVGIDRMPIDATVGRARVIAIEDPGVVRASEIEAARIRRGERILLRTRNSPRAIRAQRFVEDFVYLDDGAARLLVARGVRTVGVDYLSVGGFRSNNGAQVHEILLGAGVWIIEGLDLSEVPAGRYDLICLPLRLCGADGAPARAFVRPHLGRKENRHA